MKGLIDNNLFLSKESLLSNLKKQAEYINMSASISAVVPDNL